MVNKNEMFNLLTGRSEGHLKFLNDPSGHRLHGQAIHPFAQLQKLAKKAGFNLTVASSFRSFERQLAIFNAKAKGERALFDAHERPLNYQELNKEELLWAILRWSALPGTSRHHWGTDLDVYADNLVAHDYKIQLTRAEYESEGPFFPFHQWLDMAIEDKKSFRFFHPYRSERQGVSPEPWHISYAPLAKFYMENFTFENFVQNIEQCHELELKEVILDNALKIYCEYIINVDQI